MRIMRKLSAFLTAILLFTCFSAFSESDAFTEVYTYNYDYWEDLRESPNAYKVKTVIYSSTLGLDKPMQRPQSLFVKGDDMYVADTGNNRVLKLTLENGEFILDSIIDRVNGADVPTLSAPSDISVDNDGNIYIADKNNNRVVVMDSELNYVKQFTKPADSTFDQDASFLPNRIVTDSVGRLYVLADNVNKGLAKFEADTTFSGFIGANKVTVSMFEYIWKYYFLSDEQRAKSENAVPTRYENMYIDEEGFIYATNTVFSEYDLKWDNANPIRRINGIGDDILIKNDRYPPIGDYRWVDGTNNVNLGPSKFSDITVLEDDIYVAFDRTRGRLFGYDSQGVMLWAFGTRGNYEGAFNAGAGVSIEHMGRDLFCLDQTSSSITVFTPTEYGNLIYDANNAYVRGDYDGSADMWREALKYNANYNMAFRGIGRSLLRQSEYSEAMRYFKMAHDRINYGRAFRLYRKEWVEANIGWVIGILAAIIVFFVGRGLLKKMKFEVAMYERDHIVK